MPHLVAVAEYAAGSAPWAAARDEWASREAGFIETEHFGMRFPRRASRVELTEVTQRWLRDLLWDQLAESMRSVDCPRTAGWLDDLRRACLELSAFLELNAPGGGHDAGALRAEHARQFVADQRNRELNGRPALRIHDRSGGPSVVTATLRCRLLNAATAARPCSGMTRPRSAIWTSRSASPNACSPS